SAAVLVVQSAGGRDSGSMPLILLRDHDIADEVADEFDLLDIVIQQFNAGAFFNKNHQLHALQPIKPEILQDVRLIPDARGMNSELIRDQRADAAGADGFRLEPNTLCADPHGSAPRSPAYGNSQLALYQGAN